ncbi:MAG: CBS domain-containing protein [Rhodospirillaceae bacterium]|jgi:signal-transduction protein with cAMP-binding, CBS, and nucleotidyltransferase domain|nr:CBS domain-containing protein [Rhodospirillaceae bacterium]MBT5244599.1 CBS domain-containing protein [Rhodospirillaceae bacterium]MBT5563509.1 CBS domain-containing protein [Rhodospirillaceae bacterium]MBT6240760.1 CBS domain-containing protein [Rhodospirillaceae bacterium]MBT7137766.1 CBS domain-containing protein [Rhodospirillaceae bacterium]
MHRFIIPDVIEEHPVRSLSRTDNAFDAAIEMKKSNIAAILIVDEDGKLEGIVTERDLTRRVVATDQSPKKTLLGDIMTANPDTLDPADSAGDALEMMRKRSFRHLPVSKDGKIMGMVSVRDLYSAVKADLEDNIRETEAFVFGDRYGA